MLLPQRETKRETGAEEREKDTERNRGKRKETKRATDGEERNKERDRRRGKRQRETDAEL